MNREKWLSKACLPPEFVDIFLKQWQRDNPTLSPLSDECLKALVALERRYANIYVDEMTNIRIEVNINPHYQGE